MNARYIARVRIMAALTLLVAVVIVGRLYVLQIMNGKAYAARANAQFVEPHTPLTLRDAIYFTDKSGTLITAAPLKEGFSLAINPTKISDAATLYSALSKHLTLSRDEFMVKATKPHTQYQLIAAHLDPELARTLQKENLDGVTLITDRWRYYPGNSLAAQALGFVAYNGDVQEGRYGLERYYEQTLTRNDENLYSNFFVELFGSVKGLLEGEPQTGDLITTIEPTVQAELERTLAQYDSEWHPARLGGIIMDPQSGEIYAMAMYPNFDLNSFGAEENAHIYANPMVEDVYEMGSIMKPLTMAAGLDSGAITQSSTYNDTGCISVDEKKICNFDLKARGTIPMQEILSQSLNVGASYIATKLGKEKMREYFLEKYKFNEETGIDLPGEVHGLTNNLTKPQQVGYDTASFGQGIAITPIETVRALAILANGGKLVTPHLVRAIQYDTGITKTLGWGEGEQVISEKSAGEVSGMLTKVVDTTLANGAIKLEHYSVAAKTGTAQIANPQGGGYYTDRFLHSFFGYFPAYDAKFIVFLFAYEPQGAPFSSQTWAIPFKSLTQFLINYYDVAPDR